MAKIILVMALFLAACGPTTVVVVTPSASPTPTPENTATPEAQCQVTDQDQFIYHPARLLVQNPCLRVTGTVLILKPEADGDFHIRVQLDPAFQNLLTPANQQQCVTGICGLLVVEPVCEGSVTQADAVAICQADTDPLSPLPAAGQHVWMQGRYVLDTQHGSWAELHPLYAWGVQP